MQGLYLSDANSLIQDRVITMYLGPQASGSSSSWTKPIREIFTYQLWELDRDCTKRWAKRETVLERQRKRKRRKRCAQTSTSLSLVRRSHDHWQDVLVTYHTCERKFLKVPYVYVGYSPSMNYLRNPTVDFDFGNWSLTIDLTVLVQNKLMTYNRLRLL